MRDDTQQTPHIVIRAINALRPHASNARQHSKKQIRQIADSIRRFGFTNPVLISSDGVILAGHGRVMAAKELGLREVPTLALDHMTADERRAYVLADNKLALNAGWDQELLASELQALIELDFDVSLTGFAPAEIDQILADVDGAATDERPEDWVPHSPAQPITRSGDLWQLGKHRLLCGDARLLDDHHKVMASQQADLIFTDPPYNVPIAGHVSGLGAVQHREFAMASGEMSKAAFTEFLKVTLSNAAHVCRDGAIAFVCMDWRHMGELLEAGRAAFSELKNLCVWNKTNGGMGTFYRSKHELIFVFKTGQAPHTNNFGLGDTGRHRTNVWDYAGISSVGGRRLEELAMHPTVKPVAMLADALRDCSRRGDRVFDGFGGSGSTLVAAETCGRHARLIEYDPVYCDTTVLRWERLTGKRATLEGEGLTFEDIGDMRREEFEVAQGCHEDKPTMQTAGAGS